MYIHIRIQLDSGRHHPRLRFDACRYLLRLVFWSLGRTCSHFRLRLGHRHLLQKMLNTWRHLLLSGWRRRYFFLLLLQLHTRALRVLHLRRFLLLLLLQLSSGLRCYIREAVDDRCCIQEAVSNRCYVPEALSLH